MSRHRVQHGKQVTASHSIVGIGQLSEEPLKHFESHVSLAHFDCGIQLVLKDSSQRLGISHLNQSRVARILGFILSHHTSTEEAILTCRVEKVASQVTVVAVEREFQPLIKPPITWKTAYPSLRARGIHREIFVLAGSFKSPSPKHELFFPSSHQDQGRC